MTETQGVYTVPATDPRLFDDLLRRLDAYQLRRLISRLDEIAVTGYGEVTLCFEGQAVYIKTETSEAVGRRVQSHSSLPIE